MTDKEKKFKERMDLLEERLKILHAEFPDFGMFFIVESENWFSFAGNLCAECVREAFNGWAKFNNITHTAGHKEKKPIHFGSNGNIH